MQRLRRWPILFTICAGATLHASSAAFNAAAQEGAPSEQDGGADESSPAQRSSARHDTVLRRGEVGPVHGTIKLIDNAGILIELADLEADAATVPAARSMTIPWHRVRDVDSEAQHEAWLRYKPVADLLWRGVIRVERGDTALAEPNFERLFDQFRGQTSETALVVAEGLLRCRLARAANELAVIPWLEAARIRAADVTTSAYEDLDVVVDSTTLLCPQLPPAWPTGSQLDRLRNELEQYDAQGDSVIAALAALYGRFADAAGGDVVQPPDGTLPDHPGVQMLTRLLALRSDEGRFSAAAIDRTVRSGSDWPVWAQAWLRYHLGHALLSQGDRRANDLGLVQLAHVHARYRSEQPYLAGLALSEMAEALESRGEGEEAGSLRRLVYQRFPGHPAANAAPRDRNPEPRARP